MFMFSTAFGVLILNKGIEPALREYARVETEEIATLAINKAVNQKVVEGIDVEKLWITKENGSGDITMVSENTAMVNRITSETTNLVQQNLELAEQGKLKELGILSDIEILENEEALANGIIREIPVGIATGVAILGNLGPKIPVKFATVGSTSTNIIHEEEEVGINNVLIKVSLEIIVNVQVIVPFATDVHQLKNVIPIGRVMLPGDVPDFWNGGDGVDPSIDISN
ncbi:sporulation protein YunB [Bacillus mesophilus]|uniref:Sporulation protein YunB n=2 Tax=Bacillus mesophilus TaxID=1808955 RepID=A0A6M0Q9B1_9BACI|nr:sporulation protein YunB [Bacillus mesophilus]